MPEQRTRNESAKHEYCITTSVPCQERDARAQSMETNAQAELSQCGSRQFANQHGYCLATKVYTIAAKPVLQTDGHVSAASRCLVACYLSDTEFGSPVRSETAVGRAGDGVFIDAASGRKKA